MMSDPYPCHPIETTIFETIGGMLKTTLVAVATIGAGAAGNWASGVTEWKTIAIAGFDAIPAEDKLLSLCLGVVLQLGTLLGFLLCLAAVASLWVFLMSESYKLEGWLGLFTSCALLVYITAKRFCYSANESPWRIGVILGLSITTYLLLRLTPWLRERNRTQQGGGEERR